MGSRDDDACLLSVSTYMKCREGPCPSSYPGEKKKKKKKSSTPTKLLLLLPGGGVGGPGIQPENLSVPRRSSTDAVAASSSSRNWIRRTTSVLLTLLQLLLVVASSTAAGLTDLEMEMRGRYGHDFPDDSRPHATKTLGVRGSEGRHDFGLPLGRGAESLEQLDERRILSPENPAKAGIGLSLPGKSPIDNHSRISSDRETSIILPVENRRKQKDGELPAAAGMKSWNTDKRMEEKNSFWKSLFSRGTHDPVTDVCETNATGKVDWNPKMERHWNSFSSPKTPTKAVAKGAESIPEPVPATWMNRFQSATPQYWNHPDAGIGGSMRSSKALSRKRPSRFILRPSRGMRTGRSVPFQDRRPRPHSPETGTSIPDTGTSGFEGSRGRVFPESGGYGKMQKVSFGRNGGRRLKRKIEVSSVSVVEGEEAALPCDLRSPSPGDTVQIILWIKEGLHTPLYSYDYRELLRGRPRETKPDANSTLSRKTNFRTDRSPAALIIEDADAEDSGIYRCRVDFLHSPTLNYRVNLTVYVPPTEVRISWRAENLTLIQASGNEVGPFQELSRPTLVCSNDDGWPPPSILWYEGSQMLDDSYFFRNDRGTVENELAFDPLTRDDLGRNLTCIVSNTNKTRPAAKSVSVTLKLRIMGVRVKNLGTLWAGEEAKAECQIWGSRPPPVVLWWLGSQMFHPTETKHLDNEQNVTLSILDFYPKAVDDGAMLICQATNEMLPDQAVQDSTILAVNYMPVVNVHLGRSIDPEKIKEGDDIYFECSVASKPPAINVVWKHDGAALKPGPGLILSNVSLVVQGVTRARGGNYTCHATNVRGTSVSRPLHLDVKYTPVCATEWRQQQHSVGKEENAEISCKVDANPKEVTFRWTFNNTAEAIDVPQGRFGVVGTESRVNYTPMNELDYGTLLCWANNSIGVQQHPCVFQIVAAGKPDPPHNCRVFDVTISSLQVNCLPGDDGGLQQTFMLQVYKVGSTVPVEEVTHSFPSFSVRGLTPATSYRIALAALNEKGASRMMELNAYTLKVMESLEETSAEPTRDRDRGPSIPLAVLIGAVVVFVPVVIASIVLVWLKVRRSAVPPDEGSRNVIGCDSGSEVDANTHSSHSRDPTASSDFAALSDIVTIPEGSNPDVVLIGDPAPPWRGQTGDISTISSPPYVTMDSEKRYSASNARVTSATSSEGGAQYKQIVNQEHSYSYPEASGNLHKPGKMVSEVPYFIDSDNLQQVKRTPTRSPALQRYEANLLHFASTVELNNPKRSSVAPAGEGKEACPCGGRGPGQSFPHILPAHQGSLPKPAATGGSNSSHCCCGVHRPYEDGAWKQGVTGVQTLPRKGSAKLFAQCGGLASGQQQLPASAQSFGKSAEDVSRITRASSGVSSSQSGMPQNRPGAYQTASLSRRREQRSMEAVDAQSTQQLLKSAPAEWPWKHKRESAV